MGVQALYDVLTHIWRGLSPLSNASQVLAWIGIALIAIVVLYYLMLGIVKLLKIFWRMNIKYLGPVLLMLGLILIVLAVIIPV
jgi:uncharacterized membrane protein YidH (DUF202 family)